MTLLYLNINESLNELKGDKKMKYSKPTVGVTNIEAIDPRGATCNNGYTCGTDGNHFSCSKFTCTKKVYCQNYN